MLLVSLLAAPPNSGMHYYNHSSRCLATTTFMALLSPWTPNFPMLNNIYRSILASAIMCIFYEVVQSVDPGLSMTRLDKTKVSRPKTVCGDIQRAKFPEQAFQFLDPVI